MGEMSFHTVGTLLCGTRVFLNSLLQLGGEHDENIPQCLALRYHKSALDNGISIARGIEI